jgi:hypothetical protein
MPRHFFNVNDGKDLIDREGTELADLAQARSRAVGLACQFITESGDAFWAAHHGWRIVVSNESHRPLFTLHFSATTASRDS